MFAYSFRYKELRVFRPSVIPLREFDFLFPQGLAMRRAGVLLVRRAVGDMTLDDNEGRAIWRLLKDLQGALSQLEVVGVLYPRYLPAVAKKASRDVIAKGQVSVPLDTDLIVVIDPT